MNKSTLVCKRVLCPVVSTASEKIASPLQNRGGPIIGSLYRVDHSLTIRAFLFDSEICFVFSPFLPVTFTPVSHHQQNADQ